MIRENSARVIREVSTVNYHMLKACNMRCGFCFATFRDNPDKRSLKRDESLRLVDALCQARFKKINFAGGEPTLHPMLPESIRRAKSYGVTTSIVTNGSRITPDWLDSLGGDLDIIALSIDCVDSSVQSRMGRVENGKGPINAQQYLSISEMIRSRGIRLKVNTVVTSANWTEDLSPFIMEMQPERWKMFQVLRVDGQNDSHIGEFAIGNSQFEQYVERNRSVENSGIRVVPESSQLMTGSYVMADPLGRFFDNTEGRHTYSRPILEVGVRAALQEVTVYADRFIQRGGSYR